MTGPEIVLRTAAVLVLLALAGMMLAARRQDHTPALGLLAAAGVAAFVVTSAPGAENWLGILIYPLTALCVAKPAFFWLFARGLFTDSLRVRGRDMAIVAATMAYGLWQQLAYPPLAGSHLATPGQQFVAAGFEVWVMVLVLMMLAEAWRGLAVDLVERRRRMRILIVSGAASYLAVAVIVQGYNLVQGTGTPRALVVTNLVLITALGLAALWTLVQKRTASWLEAVPAAARADALTPLERRLLAQLQALFDRECVYREEGLTIGALARRLDTREQVLRRVINRGLGYRNFNDFLHAYRIREACQRLRRNEDALLPVLSIALSVGYGSIGPFNRAFKSRLGMTPTRYRDAGSDARSPV
jgi:AraC-like DNA-binding protein